MTPGQLLADLKGRGIVLTVEGGRLHYLCAAGLITEEEKARLGTYKLEVMDLLRAEAIMLLNAVGARIMSVGAGFAIGTWADLVGPEIKAALHAVDMGGLPVRYLDGTAIPPEYQVRWVAGEPVPQHVLAAMEADQTGAPWLVRDRMLREIGWRAVALGHVRTSAT